MVFDSKLSLIKKGFMNIAITGASKGIGLELTRLALTDGHIVCAIARTANQSVELKKLAAVFNKKLLILDADVTDSTTAPRILNAIIEWGTLDMLVNNAGILEKEDSEKSLMRSFQVNSIAPFLLTTALLPKLKAGARPVVIQITSRMGSIADTSSSGHCGYRASKAALNMFNKSIAVENPWLTAIVVHPGWVQTDMGGAGAPVKPADSARGIWNVIEKAKKNSLSGKFFDYKGENLPW